MWLSHKNLKTKRPSNKLDVRRIGPFCVIRMVGKHAAELLLPSNMSRLHPVFNVSLLMPYVETRFKHDKPEIRNPQHFFDNFLDWGAITYILDYRTGQKGIYEYLVRGLDSLGLDDGWRLLTTIPPSLDPYLCRFHSLSPQYSLGPSMTVWDIRAQPRGL